MSLLSYLKKKENSAYLNRLKRTAKKVLALEPKMQTLSNDELKAKTDEFKSRIQSGETLDDILIEAFAVAREMSSRVLNMKHYDVQVIGGIALHEGNIAEMKTGEGKTLVGTLPAYLNALTDKGVHIVTVNEYLANRDHEIMSPLYRALGLTTSVITSEMSNSEKREAYQADIVYITNTEVGFDYLRDNMVMRFEDKVQRELNFCIIDEVDSVLLDDARTPLIISGQGEEPSKMYHLADMFARTLVKNVDFTIDEETRSVMLNENGIDKAEKMFRVENYTDMNNGDLRFYIEKALQAHYMMKRDRDYIIRNNEILIIDESTGRISEGRRFSYGLHQALEAKEGVRIKRENQTLASITYQNFFLLYNKLSGMTGTATTNAEEFMDIYRLRVITIPTNKPVIRKDHPDKLFITERAKNKAIVKDVRSCYEKGQPVLIGTSSIEKSEKLSELLTQENIPHVVLNAKNHAREAEIIANAGQKHAVTIATNMAGRGTDIKLGEGVRELGGLKVIGTERATNRRIDNQLIGRSGRQGDPGESQFYLSFDDDLLRIFTPKNIKKSLSLLSEDSEDPIETKMLIKSIHSAQSRIEGMHFDMRKQTIEYDAINNEQRVIVYNQRNQILDKDFDVLEMYKKITTEVLQKKLDDLLLKIEHFVEGTKEWRKAKNDLNEFCEKIDLDKVGVELTDELTKKQVEYMKDYIAREVERRIELIAEMELNEQFREMALQTVDIAWRKHLNNLDAIKEAVRFSGFKQVKPIDEYSRLTYEAFNQTMEGIQNTFAMHVMNVRQVENMETKVS